MVKVCATRECLGALATLPEVQAIELSRSRITANDLSRAATGVASNSVTPFSYLGLTGTNVTVNVNDTGVDATQPELAGRVWFDVPSSGTDSNGHGTHIAGIIASSGQHSETVGEVPGSILPAVDLQFRGGAPAATIFAIAAELDAKLVASDTYLQQTAALSNAFISKQRFRAT